MSRKRRCRMPGRDLCCPEGKIAALFVDIDGTILKCQPYFDAARDLFAHFMMRLGFNAKQAIALLEEIDYRNSEKYGFVRARFSQSMVETYSTLCKRKGFRRNKNDLALCEAIGQTPFFREPELFPNAAAVLGRARHNFKLIAVTLGDRDVQKHKLRQPGLSSLFDHMIFLENDGKPAQVEAAIADLQIDPALSAFIGNSVRSDGGCLVNTNFIHLALEDGWEFDKAKSELPKETRFEAFKATDWRQAEEIINRLLRRREVAMEMAGTGCGE